MITAKLKRIVPLEPNAQVEVAEHGVTKTFDLLEFEPGPNKRYMVTVEVGNLPPREAHSYISKVRGHLKGFFPEGTLLVAATRDGQPMTGIYEVEIQ